MGWRTRRWSSGRWWSVSVTLLAAVVRLTDLGTRSLWFDEAFTVLVTRLPLRESLSALLTLGAYSPFYYLVLRPVVAVLGQSEFAYRFSAAVFGILTVPLLYRVGRCWLGQRAGLLAALALSVCPFHLLYSQDGRMYAMMGFFSLAAMDRFVSVLRGSKCFGLSISLRRDLFDLCAARLSIALAETLQAFPSLVRSPDARVVAVGPVVRSIYPCHLANTCAWNRLDSET
jgi:4-amino-4-deoxy-L-arabinose transferase-like glycosyltransferase